MFFAWKIDLAKAYDRLQWSFIKNVIMEVGISSSLVELIIWCVTSVQYQVILNGEMSEQFTHRCGIRQGIPPSPYLLVLCTEKLSHLITQKVHSGMWKCVKISRGPIISHIFFADDLILFGQATIPQADLIRGCLKEFCNLSGQQISFSKFRVFCSTKIKEGVARILLRFLVHLLLEI
ncbi:hypothetical protein Dsin_013802 [Dipteronia sinensis]|uniref:Reverse transcriptase domain-containing protein n=1 Tax=Dipteronia sinensis TaxID=43782 RepID=A0AAE0E9S6_9ROSI|nr:hypothetical protein Dsin_013802 [Dipteronia sinensis]